MSGYTTQLRYIIEQRIGLNKSLGYNSVNDIINQGRQTIFNFDYPIFDENYRGVLETKIIKHFYTREIAYETVGRWNLALDEKMNLIMPYYNTLYKVGFDKINPLNDVDLTTTHKRDTTGVSDSDSETSSNTASNANDNNKSTTTTTSNSSSTGSTSVDASSTNRDAYSNTPQGSLSNVENNEYLTDYRKITNDNNSTTTTNNNDESTSNINNEGESTSNSSVNSKGSTTQKIKNSSLENYLETVTGKTGARTYGEMYKSFIESLVNIDAMIIDELESLFMQIWEVSQ